MHPGYMWYWKQRQRRGRDCGPMYASGGCASTPHDSGTEWMWVSGSRRGDRVFGSGGFGIRRPVRFLADRLDLDDRQVTALSRIVERIRIEREQAAVDLRRAAGEFADVLEASEYRDDPVSAAGRRRVDAATSVQEVVTRALRDLHELLDAEQRAELATLIRTGAIKL